MKLKLYIVWSVALCLALLVPQFAQASPPPPPIVEWTPRVLQHSLQAGQSILMRITATAPLDLYRAVVVPSLSLAPFIYIEPPGPRKFVRKGGKIIRNIRITMPSNISGANIQGLVRLSAALTSSGPAQIRRGALVISLPGWKSGARNNSYTLGFASWRGQSNGVVIGWIDWKNGWAGMYTYASGFSPRQIRAKSSNVSFGHGLFPLGGILAACAAGEYDDEQRQVASRLSQTASAMPKSALAGRRPATGSPGRPPANHRNSGRLALRMSRKP